MFNLEFKYLTQHFSDLSVNLEVIVAFSLFFRNLMGLFIYHHITKPLLCEVQLLQNMQLKSCNKMALFMFCHLTMDIIGLNVLIILILKGKGIILSLVSESTNASLEIKREPTFFFISLSFLAVAKLTKNVITCRSWEMITVPLEVNLAWYSPLFQSHTEVILGLHETEEITFCI